ncbi:hypothetical protein AB0I76_23180, partial [Micromonospora sp. NPDC049799]
AARTLPPGTARGSGAPGGGTPGRSSARTTPGLGHQLDALDRGDAAHLQGARVWAAGEPAERGRLGMCGLLDTYPAGG